MNAAQDLRQALRRLANTPFWSGLVIITLAVGIGGAVTVLTLLDAVFWRPLPVREPDSLVLLNRQGAGEPFYWHVSYPDFRELKSRNNVFTELAGSGFDFVSLETEAGSTLRAVAQLASQDYFRVLGVQAALGRVLEPDDITRRRPVAVLSHALWSDRFQASRDVLGKTVRINGNPVTVVGVMAPQFNGLMISHPTHLWIPVTLQPLLGRGDFLEGRDFSFLYLFGRLQDGISPQQAQQAISSLEARLDTHFGSEPNPRPLRIMPLSFARFPLYIREEAVRYSSILLFLVGCVLFVSCANVASLTLLRTADRRGEFALRIALGTPRGRLAAQVVLELVLVTFIAGCLSLWIAYRALPLFKNLQQPTPITGDLSIDLRVIALSLLVCMLTLLASGLAPALASFRVQPFEALRGGCRMSGAAGRQVLQRLLVIAQVAFSLVLLVGAGLLVRSHLESAETDLGFDPGQVLFGYLGDETHPLPSPQQEAGFLASLFSDLERLPGVVSLGVGRRLPLSVNRFELEIFPDASQDPAERHTAYIEESSAGAFQALGIKVIQGRGFSRQDQAQSERVCVVSESLAEHHWPGKEPVGQRLKVAGEDDFKRVVGVVADTKYLSIFEAGAPIVYLPFSQRFHPIIGLFIRTSADPYNVLPELQQVFRQWDLPFWDVTTLSEQVDQSLAPIRLGALLAVSAALMLLVLALGGLFSVLAHRVQRRQREFALRMALGALPRRLQGSVVREALLMSAIGVLIGVPIVLLTVRHLSGLLYKVSSHDAGVYAAAVLTIVLASVLAALLPARRASNSDLSQALRQEQ